MTPKDAIEKIATRYCQLVQKFSAIRNCTVILGMVITLSGIAAEEPCRVIAVIRGDEFVIECGNKTETNRLDEIEAPDLGQPYGRASRGRALALCLNRKFILDERRFVDGFCYCKLLDEHGNLVSERLLDDGSVWSTRDQAGRQSLLATAHQEDARIRRVGLWRLGNPIRPSEWRARHGVGKLRVVDYDSFDEAKRDIYPKWDEKASAGRKCFSSQRKGSSGGTVRALPVGDFEVENVFTYWECNPVGEGLVKRDGKLISIRIQVNYAGKEPNDAACEQAVKDYYGKGMQIPIEIGVPGKILSARNAMCRRFGADKAEPVYAGAAEGKLYVFLGKCDSAKADPTIGPASYSGRTIRARSASPVPGDGILNIQHRRKDAAQKTFEEACKSQKRAH